MSNNEPGRAHRSVARLSELRDHYVTIVAVDDVDVALVRRGEVVTAFDGICSHARFLVGPGPIRNDCIECPMHMARFAAADGAVVKGPAKQPLPSIEIAVAEGEVWIDPAELTRLRRSKEETTT